MTLCICLSGQPACWDCAEVLAKCVKGCLCSWEISYVSLSYEKYPSIMPVLQCYTTKAENHFLIIHSYVCPINGIYTRYKHTDSGDTPKAALREEMKWLIREITGRGNWFPQPVTPRPSQVGFHTRQSCVWWIDLLNANCHLLYTSMAALNKNLTEESVHIDSWP